jgi:hypothetical protein
MADGMVPRAGRQWRIHGCPREGVTLGKSQIRSMPHISKIRSMPHICHGAGPVVSVLPALDEYPIGPVDVVRPQRVADVMRQFLGFPRSASGL